MSFVASCGCGNASADSITVEPVLFVPSFAYLLTSCSCPCFLLSFVLSSSYGEYGAGQAGTASSEQEPAQFSLGGTPIGGGPIGSGVAPGRPGDALPDALGVRGLDTPAEVS